MYRYLWRKNHISGGCIPCLLITLASNNHLTHYMPTLETGRYSISSNAGKAVGVRPTTSAVWPLEAVAEVGQIPDPVVSTNLYDYRIPFLLNTHRIGAVLHRASTRDWKTAHVTLSYVSRRSVHRYPRPRGRGQCHSHSS